MGLPLVWDARGRHDLARDEHLHVRALVRPDPGPLDVRAEAHADVIALGSRAEHLERPLYKRGVVAAVVHDLIAVLPHDADLVRKLVGLNEVAATDLDAVESELGGDRIEGSLHHEAGMRAARAAIWRRGYGVGVHIAEPHPVVGHAIRPGHLGGGDDRQDDSVRRVGAAVVDEVDVEREDVPVAVEPDLDLVHLPALLIDRGEVLLAVLGPFDGPAELHRRERDQQLVGVEQHDLRSEAAAHVWSDDVYIRFGKTEEHGQAAPNRGRRLGGIEDGEPVLGLRPARPHGAAFHRAGGAPFEPQMQLLAIGRGGERGLHVSRFLQHLGRDVAGDVGVDEVLRDRGNLRRDHDRQRLVLDLDQVGRVLGDVSVLRDHECDRLAGVAHDLRSEATLGAAVGEVGMRDQDGEVGVAERQVGGHVYSLHAGHRPRRADVDRLDAGVRERRANEHRLQRTLIDVVGEVAAPAQQPVVFDALHPRPEPTRRHLDSSAARCTARRIEA